MTSFAVDLIESALELPQQITDVALQDPLSLVLVALGSLLLVASVGVFGFLALGGIVDAVTPDVSREPTNREVR